MTKKVNPFLVGGGQAQAATPAVPQSMEELAALIATTTIITPEHRATMCANLNRTFELLPALRQARPNGRVIGPLLSRLHPVTTGLSLSRLGSLKGSVKSALKIGYNMFPGAQHRTGLTGEWKNLFDKLGHRTPLQMNMSRLAHWLQQQWVEPKDVNDIWQDRYIAYLTDVVTVEKPLHVARVAASSWNLAVSTIPGWPAQTLTLPSSRKVGRAPALSELSESCRAGFQAYAELMKTGSDDGGREQFDLGEDDEDYNETDDKGFAAYSKATQGQRQQLLRRALGLIATATRRDIGAVEFSELSWPRTAALILTTYKKELGNDGKAPSLLLMALTLSAVAKHFFKVDAKTLKKFHRLAGDAGKLAREEAKKNPGMTQKNRKRLQQIGPAQLRALFQAPALLIGTAIQRIHRGIATTSDLVDAQVGAAIAILLHAAIRAANLASIKLGGQLHLMDGDEGTGHLRFESNETKTGRVLEFELPLDLTRLLKRFVSEVLPAFPRSMVSNALFAGQTNETKGSGLLGSQITSRVSDIVGVKMNQHLFRHFLALLYLERHPGNYEVVQDLLGHLRVETTRKYYCGLETLAAIKSVHDCLAGLKSLSGLDPSDMSRIVGMRVSGAKRKRNTVPPEGTQSGNSAAAP
jgi:integrase